MRKLTSIGLALMVAMSAVAISTKDAQAHRWHRGGGWPFGIAAATIAGIALSRHHHRHYRYYDYDYGYPRYYGGYGYYGGYPYYRRHYYSSYSPRFYGGYNAYNRIGRHSYGGHGHHRHRR